MRTQGGGLPGLILTTRSVFLLAGQVIFVVGVQCQRPPIPDDCPPALSQLISQCWDDDPAARPQFTQIMARLQVRGGHARPQYCAWSAGRGARLISSVPATPSISMKHIR